MKFLKDNSYDIVKLFINQIGIAIFSLALYSAESIAISNDASLSSTVEIILSVAATAFYLVLVYIAAWDIGSKDQIRIETDKMRPDKLKGLRLGLLANVPNFVLCGSAVVFMGIFLATGTAWCESVFAVLNLFFGFLESMYLGVIINLLPLAENAPTLVNDTVYFYRSIAYLLAPLVSVGATTLGYILGTKNFRIFSPSSKNKK